MARKKKGDVVSQQNPSDADGNEIPPVAESQAEPTQGALPITPPPDAQAQPKRRGRPKKAGNGGTATKTARKNARKNARKSTNGEPAGFTIKQTATQANEGETATAGNDKLSEILRYALSSQQNLDRLYQVYQLVK